MTDKSNQRSLRILRGGAAILFGALAFSRAEDQLSAQLIKEDTR